MLLPVIYAPEGELVDRRAAYVRYTIAYQYATYSGTHTVTLREDDDRDPIAIMWHELREHMTLGMASKSARVISVDPCEEGDY